MKLYIAGPMSGHENFNYPAFFEAEEQLKHALRRYDDLVIENPAGNYPLVIEPEWADFMRMSLTQMLTCDAVALLPGWSMSRGARIEAHLARELGLTVKSLEKWVTSHERV